MNQLSLCLKRELIHSTNALVNGKLSLVVIVCSINSGNSASQYKNEVYNFPIISILTFKEDSGRGEEEK